MSAFNQGTAKAFELNLCAGIRHSGMLKHKFGVERLPYKKRFPHPPPPINSDKL